MADPELRQGDGDMYIATIGIDNYQSWTRLNNAASDARGVMNAFEKLGFKSIRDPLLNEQATRSEMRALVTRDLARLGDRDSLVVFFAGHGWTVTDRYGDGSIAHQGFIIPANGLSQQDAPNVTQWDIRQTWLDVDEWLTEIQRLHPRHILVILDSCHSGIAIRPAGLGRIVHGQGAGAGEQLWSSMSRRLITASHANQSALDSGPVAGHSLFTGCLIRLLETDFIRAGRPFVTGTQLGACVQTLVLEHSNERQTPDVSALVFDNRGEMRIPLTRFTARPNQARAEAEIKRLESAIDRGLEPSPTNIIEQATVEVSFGNDLIARLDRHHVERQLGGRVLSAIASTSVSDIGWATWAAQRGIFTLSTSRSDFATTVADLLSQIPWMRAQQAARARFAAAARRSLEELDAALDGHSEREREQWIRRAGGADTHILVAGWLVSTMHKRFADVIDLDTAPVHGVELLAVVCDLVAPISILVQSTEPTADSVGRAVHIAARLVGCVPRHAIAVASRDDLLEQVLQGPDDSAAISMARQGLANATKIRFQPSSLGRPTAAQQLWDALQSDPQTAGHFELHTPVRIHEQPGSLAVALVARRVQLVIQIDTWYRRQDADADAYRRDRIQDVWLQRAGFFVIRLLAEDIAQHLESQVETIATCLQTRTAAQFHGRDRS